MSMTSADYAVLIDEFRSQFTEDRAHNLKVVRDYCERLTDSPEDQAKLVVVAQFMASEFPETVDQQKIERLKTAIDAFHERVAAIQKLAANRQFEAAAAGFEEILGKMEPIESEQRRYLSFNQTFEGMLFSARNKDKRPVTQISNLPEVLFYQYAMVLFELKRFDEAKVQLQKCLKLDPNDVRVYFELIEIAKIEQDLEGARALLKSVHPLIFTRPALARYYRTQALLANLDRKYRLAVALNYVSLDYEDHPVARAQINALAKIKGVDLSKPKVAEVRALVADTDIVLGPNEEVYGLAMEVGAKTRQSHPQLAAMAFSIAYDLTHYQPLLRDLEQLGVVQS